MDTLSRREEAKVDETAQRVGASKNVKGYRSQRERGRA